MKKYLTAYDTTAEYEAVESSLITPYVALTRDNRALHYQEYVETMNIITYEASAKLTEVTSGSGLHTNAFSGKDGQLTITSHTFENGVGTIEFNDDVTVIGNRAFDSSTSLTSITIPNSVTSIGNSAFSECRNLKRLNSDTDGVFNIPNNVTSIGNGTFNYCISLVNLLFGNSLTTIPSYAFSGCSNLTSITIPNSVISIGVSAFRGCESLASIAVESSNTKYDSRDNCNAIIETSTNMSILGCKNTVIPNTVTSIGKYTFETCTSLTSITIPNSVTSIGNSAFSECRNLKRLNSDTDGVFNIPNSVTSIGENAFNNCSSLTSVTIPNSVTSIGREAFRSCTGLTGVTIPNSVTVITKQTFYNSSNLSSVIIGTGVTSIANDAFGYCKLESIVVTNGNMKYDSRNNCNGVIETNTNTLILGCKNTVIPNSVTSIGTGAFRECQNLISYVIPNSITNIGEYAFYSCRNMTAITIPNSVTSIADRAFHSCISLLNISCNAVTAPTIQSSTFNGVKTNGTLTVPSGSTGYDVWMGTGDYYLGKYGWTKVEQ